MSGGEGRHHPAGFRDKPTLKAGRHQRTDDGEPAGLAMRGHAQADDGGVPSPGGEVGESFLELS